ncbi:sulfite exporter TauE/SafE family protein [Parahaliea mediterranea]|uniref:sulfite exporter TauE/SafE family protein n=1 Tax=Parahaliea mediterranea TaxID=651086 RepID=UPI000E2F9281|nr:sulfite exporter TauE/SafE family protein [Parahaliea mediterranea]
MGEYLLLPLAFLTSALAGAIGMGGGVLLLTLMPGLVPAPAILPLHALTQLASNLSRAAFGWRHIDWRLEPAVAAGGTLGAAVGGGIYRSLSLDWLPAVIGVLILLLTWLPLPQPRGRGQGALALLGFYQTGLGMVAGATGPLGAAVLARYSVQRDWLVVNTAVYMSISHLLRGAAFGLMGFSLGPWLGLLAGMIGASVLGSWVGTRLRAYLPQANFQRWFRLLVSLLALRMIALVLWPG